MTYDIKSSIDKLSESMVADIEGYFTQRGLEFDRKAFMNEITPMVEFVSETAHFTGSNILKCVK